MVVNTGCLSICWPSGGLWLAQQIALVAQRGLREYEPAEFDRVSQHDAIGGLSDQCLTQT